MMARRSLWLLFADNFWLFSSGPRELSIMTVAWLEILKKYGWNVPLQETTWCTTGSDDCHHWKVEVFNECLPRASRAVGFKVLGVQLTFDNCFEVELQNRMARAWRAFYKYVDLLCCHDAPLSSRLSLLSTLVSTSLFWCCGSWNLTARQVSKLKGMQQQMLHKMVALRRHDGESQTLFMARFHSKIKTLKALHCFEDWDRLFHGRVFKWAGHIARMAQYDPGRLTSRVLQFKCWKWITKVAQSNGGNQLHGKRLRIWRWERPLYKHSPNWQEEAQDKSVWYQQLESMVSRRCQSR